MVLLSLDRVEPPQLLTALPGVLLVLLCCIPRWQAHVRQRLRPYILQRTLMQREWIPWAQKRQSRVISLAVDASAFTVSVEFYIALLPLVFWCGDDKFGTLLAFSLALCTYTTCALKDLLCSPRPFTQGLKCASSRVRMDEDIEYGAPSLHVSMTVCLCWYTLHEVFTKGLISASWQIPLLLSAFCWVIWIAWTRLYLGVHYPVDLVLGLLVGWSVVSLWTTLDEFYLDWVVSSRYAPLVQVTGSFVLLHNYPRPEIFTASYVHATTFVGAWFGAVLVTSSQLATIPLADALQAIGWDTHVPFLARLLCGYAIVLTTKLLAKPIFLAVLPYIFSAIPPKLRTVLQPPVGFEGLKGQEDVSILTRKDGTPWDIDTTARFLSYACVALAAKLYGRVV